MTGKDFGQITTLQYGNKALTHKIEAFESRAQYDNLMENLHIRQSKANYEWLKESIKQAEDGKLIKFDVGD